MPSLSIKDVPEEWAQKLRERAAANHRSLQGELMALIHEAVAELPGVREPETPPYRPKKAARKTPPHGRRLTLEELWERSRRLGGESDSDSVEIVRNLRDARHRR